MSDATHSDPDSHEGLIRTPKQLVVVLVASFVLPVIIIIMLINFVAWDTSRPRAATASAPRQWRGASNRWVCPTTRTSTTPSQ